MYVHEQSLSTKNLFLKIGGWLAFVQLASVVFAIAGYFIWPHVFTDAEKIFQGINEQPFVYFMRLDPIVLFGTLLQFPVWVAIWIALKDKDQGLSMLALLTGLISTVAVLTARPLIELFNLASRYGATDDPTEQIQFVTSGEVLLTQFNGTAWAVSIIFGGIAAIIFGVIMLKSNNFGTSTAAAMIISGLGALFVLVPVVGVILLFFLATIGGVVASFLVGLDLLKLSRKKS